MKKMKYFKKQRETGINEVYNTQERTNESPV